MFTWKDMLAFSKEKFKSEGKMLNLKGKVKKMSSRGWGGKCMQGTRGRSPVSWTNVQCLLTRSYMGSWGLYYTPVGHHVNPGMIHHAQECPDTRWLVIHIRLQICHCKSCGTSCLSKTKPLYILNQRSVTAAGTEHPGCLVTSAGLQMDFMALWVLRQNHVKWTHRLILELLAPVYWPNCPLWHTAIELIPIVLITCSYCTFRASHLLLLINLADLILKFIMILDIPKEFTGAALLWGYMTQ